MAIEYETLLYKLLERKRISKKKHAEYLSDEDALPNDISCEGKRVLTLGWDGNFPGCSGAVWIVRWKGFFFCQSSDYDPEGPFESMDEALDVEWFSTVTSQPELSSESLSLRKLLNLGRGLVGEEGDHIDINGTSYVLKNGKLKELE